MTIEREDVQGSRYYPMFVSLDGRVCLVVGAGSVGERKIGTLLRYGAQVRVVARALTERLEAQRRDGRISWVGESYEESQLDGADLAFAATSDPALNRRVAEDAARRKIWCNMATDPELGSFIVPSSFQRGPLTIAISTTGQSPAIAKRIREILEKEFGPSWTVFLSFLGDLRAAIQARGLESSENQRLFREIAALPVPEWIESGEHGRIIEAVYDICRPWLGTEELNLLWDKTWKQFSSS